MSKLKCCENSEKESSKNVEKIKCCCKEKFEICLDHKILTLLAVMFLSGINACILMMYFNKHKKE